MFGRGRILGIDLPVQVVAALAFFVIGGLFLYKTKWGRHTMAIGVNRQAAFRAGLPIRGIPMTLYCCTALTAGLVALIQLGRLDAAPPTIGEELELLVLSAVLLGGVSFVGGRGNLMGVAAGVLFIGVLNNGLLLMGVPAFWFRVSEGAALVLAAGVEAISLRREERAHGLAPPRRRAKGEAQGS
jgi:ribose/xylose/arabinose/galactoside ABC-type transport system permease subunit